MVEERVVAIYRAKARLAAVYKRVSNLKERDLHVLNEA